MEFGVKYGEFVVFITEGKYEGYVETFEKEDWICLTKKDSKERVFGTIININESCIEIEDEDDKKISRVEISDILKVYNI